MPKASDYWTLPYPISGKELLEVKDYWLQHFPNFDTDTVLTTVEEEELQLSLIEVAKDYSQPTDIKSRILALLCLRCKISNLIYQNRNLLLQNVSRISRALNPKESLSFLLNDNCRLPIIFNLEGKLQIFEESGAGELIQENINETLTMRVLKTYRWDAQPRKSLINWIVYILPQYLIKYIGDFLIEVSSIKATGLCSNKKSPKIGSKLYLTKKTISLQSFNLFIEETTSTKTIAKRSQSPTDA